MSESKWLCTCKSVRNYYQKPTEVDNQDRCIHCRHYAIAAPKKRKFIDGDGGDYGDVGFVHTTAAQRHLDYVMNDLDIDDELAEYEDEFKKLEK